MTVQLHHGDKPVLLDAFCGQGGAAYGYKQAGFYVIGCDIEPQPRYAGDGFYRMDAFDFIRQYAHLASAIHCSPPCQGYSRMRHLPWLKGRVYPMLIDETRNALSATKKVWVIENVEGAPLLNGITLCGTMFGLKVYRHRRFESSVWLHQPQHRKHIVTIGAGRMFNARQQPNAEGWVSLPSKARGTPLNGARGNGETIAVAGHFSGQEAARAAMGIDWMTRDGLSQAIPPAYTKFIGEQLIEYARVTA